MARKFANYIQNRRIEPVLKPTLRADSLGTDSSAQAARVGSKIEPKFGSGADSESLHLELSPSLGTKRKKKIILIICRMWIHSTCSITRYFFHYDSMCTKKISDLLTYEMTCYYMC